MATQLGNITKSLGREFGIIMSNMAGNDIFSNSSLRENSIIVSSPINSETLEDKGTYNIFVTDGDGKPIRLSYTIQPGNGLITINNGDVIKMSIDGESELGKGSICVDGNGTIFVNKHNIIDEFTLKVNPSNVGKLNGEIGVVTSNLDKSSDISYGISKSDTETNTTYIDPRYPGQIRVNTQALDTVDDESNRDGIIKHSSVMSRTIKAENGKLEVLTYNLTIASKDNLGVVKVDDKTIYSNNGTLNVLTEGLEHSSKDKYGISKGDEKTITSKDGVLSVNTQNLDKASTKIYGTVVLDENSLEVDENTGVTKVKDYSYLSSLLITNPNEHAEFSKEIDDLKNRVFRLENMKVEEIDVFEPDGETITVLPKPTLNEQNQIEDLVITKTIPFNIKSNCDYYLKVEYKLNENPAIRVVSVKVGDGNEIYNFSTEKFEATNNKTTTLNITFEIKNYNNDDVLYAVNNTTAMITVCSINDANIRRVATHTFTRWNNNSFKPVKEPEITPDDPSIPITSNLIIHKNSGQLSYFDSNVENYIDHTGAYSYHTNTVSYQSSYNGHNFYFNYTVDATYTYNDSTGQIYYTELSELKQSATDEIPLISIKDENNVTPDWLTYEISATYNTTRKFNVLNVKSTKPILEDRVAYITLSIPSNEIVPTIGTINTERFISSKVDLSNSNISIIDELKKIKNNLILLNEKAIDANVNNITREVSRVKNSNSQIIDSFSEKVIDRVFVENLEQKFNTVLRDLEINENTLNSSLNDNTVTLELPTKIKNTTKARCLEELSYIQKNSVNIFNRFNIYNDIFTSESNVSGDYKSIMFKYEEKIKETLPKLSVTSIIEPGLSYVTFNVERTNDSIVVGNKWGVNVIYNFVDKNGTAINTNGSTTNPKDYEYPIEIDSSQLSTTKTITDSDIQIAQSGVYNTTAERDKFYDVISINAEVTNNNFLFISTGDSTTIRFSSYSWDNSKGGVYYTIPDNVYLVLQCWNTQSNKWINTYNLKGYTSGKTFEITDALNFNLLGLSSRSDGSRPSFMLKIGNIKYKCGSGNTIPVDSSSDSYKEKRATEQYPVRVNNNIVGIKIKEVLIRNYDGTYSEDNPAKCFKFGGENYSIENPGNSISVYSMGSWLNTTNSNNYNYTFGDAYVSSVKILPWDDFEMIIEFKINPGKNTNIPAGTSINNEYTNSYGKTNFIFLEDSSSYDYKQLYNEYRFESTPWTTQGCNVKFILYNKCAPNYNAMNKTKTIMFDKDMDLLNVMYTPDGIPYAKNHPQRDNTYDRYPLFTKMDSIKFWFTLSASGDNISDKFCVSKSSISDKILLGKCHYMDGESKSINIINALYEENTNSNKNQIVYITYNNTYANTYGGISYMNK